MIERRDTIRSTYLYLNRCSSWKFGIENGNTLSKIIHLISVTKWAASQTSEVISKNVVIVLLHAETRGHQGSIFFGYTYNLTSMHFLTILKVLKYYLTAPCKLKLDIHCLNTCL